MSTTQLAKFGPGLKRFGNDLNPFGRGLTPLNKKAHAAARDGAVTIPTGLKLTRRAKRKATLRLLHVANAAKHIGTLPEPGESIHAVMKGNFDCWSLVGAIIRLANVKVDRLTIATLGFNRTNAAELVGLVDTGTVAAVDFVCSCYFKSTSADEFGFLHGELTARGQRIVACRNHAKLQLFEFADGRRFVVETSANLRSCKNVELFALHHDAALLDFHRSWVTMLIEGGDQK